MAFLSIFAAVLATAAAVNDWENLEVNSRNRLEPRSYSMPLQSEKDAFTAALEPHSPYKLSLNGTWKLSWTGDPKLRVRDFHLSDFDDSRWFAVEVPGCLELQGFGSPHYTNQKYPHKMQWPLIRDRQTGKNDYNPVGSYRRKFTVPESWKGRRTILRFDGVYSAYYVWINGEKVGYAEDSKLPSEFDVTRFLRPGENVLAVEVFRWCDGSYLEDQDMTRFSGIFRDVTLWSMPHDGIWDFKVDAKCDGSLAVDCPGASWKLYDAEFKEVQVPVRKVKLWSAEKPYLYTLVLKKGTDIRMKRIGFKEQKIVGNVMLVNGKKIKLKGVNRHETNPEKGRTVSLADMIRDITLMKLYNINTVRTAHYPDHRLWYDLCDRYGIYLVAEANVEAHEPGYGENGLGRFPEWEHSIKERNLRHIRYYRNHPSVTMWSAGNETGHGEVFTRTIAAMKELDPTRPVHWERGNADADVDGRMYPTVEWLEKRGRMGENMSGSVGEENASEHFAIAGQNPAKPFFLCEYAHAMGNAIGNFEEYWDVFYRYDSLVGGCIWDWIDQAVWKYTDRFDPKIYRRVRYLAYGGDFDEQPNDGPFCNNGVIDPERNVTPKLVEVGHVHRNLIVRYGNGGFTLENRFGFTDANEFDGVWELLADGEKVDGGSFEVPSVPPLSSAKLESLPKFRLDGDKEYFLNVGFVLKRDEIWAQKGWEVSRNQLALKELKRALPESAASAAGVEIVETTSAVKIAFGKSRAEISRASGTLSNLVMDGVTVLSDPLCNVNTGPRLTCERAFVDNDRWLQGDTRRLAEGWTFLTSGLTQLSYHPRPIEVKGNQVKVTTEITGSKSAGFTHECVWTFAADGSLTLDNKVVPHGAMPAALPRLGLSMRLADAMEQMRYYGRGPEENYIDRKSASFFRVWDSCVSNQYVRYVRPQDNGYKSDVRWVAFYDGSGKGVRFSASDPLFVQALRCSREDMQFARHQNGQQRRVHMPVQRNEVFLNLDLRQLGLGGASCGPAPMDKYRFAITEENWRVRFEPYDARAAAK
jgi:beta-galactosidase